MQYHAVSLARSGLFSEVRCIGLDLGNKVCEDLQQLVPQKNEKRSADTTKTPVTLDYLIKSDNLATKAADSGGKISWLKKTASRVSEFFSTFWRALWAATTPLPTATGPTTVVIAVQTPPAVPFLLLLHLVWALRTLQPIAIALFAGPGHQPLKVRLVVDFHNFGFTLMAIDKRPKLAVGIYRLLELVYGCGAAHFTVSHAMKDQLCWESSSSSSAQTKTTVMPPPTFIGGFVNMALPSASVTVVPDCAPDFFGPCDRYTFYKAAFALAVGERNATSDEGDADRGDTASTDSPLSSGDNVRLKEEMALLKELNPPRWFIREASTRPSKRRQDASSPIHILDRKKSWQQHLLVVSSTSWTADDDYTMVVEALEKVDSTLKQLNSGGKNDFRLWFVGTGKGQTRGKFEQQCRDAKFSPFLTVSTCYFQSFKLYAKMLAVSDLGVCVHDSSSGLDLPMKVVDMFGCHLPVAALQYPGIGELVTPQNGWTFSSGDELAKILLSMFVAEGSTVDDGEGQSAVAAAVPPAGLVLLKQKREYLSATVRCWQDSWNERALPVIQQVVA